jgi:bifunctional N-acetylglucosamine-1-phosphate-uridyltransferase/glucosamine-1-phosphate-acetyltransferase GlmU-like protein
MSPLLAQVLREIEQLNPEELLEVISHTTEQLKRQTVKQKKHKLSEFRGIAPNLLEGQDAQDWVNEIRGEWQEREQRLFEGL